MFNSLEGGGVVVRCGGWILRLSCGTFSPLSLRERVRVRGIFLSLSIGQKDNYAKLAGFEITNRSAVERAVPGVVGYRQSGVTC
ncbi:hypothetical protein D3C78_1635090 [compost metagenome]